MGDQMHLRIQFDDLREFDVSVHIGIVRKSWEWSFRERSGLSMTCGGRSSKKRYRSGRNALDDCMVALIDYHGETDRP